MKEEPQPGLAFDIISLHIFFLARIKVGGIHWAAHEVRSSASCSLQRAANASVRNDSVVSNTEARIGFPILRATTFRS